MNIPILGEIVSSSGVQPDSHKFYMLIEVLPKCKKELQSFLGIMCYGGKYSTEICELLRKITSVKAEWTWNKSYQDIYKKAKDLKKKNHMHEVLQ